MSTFSHVRLRPISGDNIALYDLCVCVLFSRRYRTVLRWIRFLRQRVGDMGSGAGTRATCGGQLMFRPTKADTFVDSRALHYCHASGFGFPGFFSYFPIH